MTAESLAWCLKRSCAIVVTWFRVKYARGDIPRAVFATVRRTTYTSGKIFGGFRDLGIPTYAVVSMFTKAGPDVMRDEDRETLSRLPSRFSVYRGTIGTGRQALWSLSWTTQQSVAATFAGLHHAYDNKPGVVFTGTVSKIDVLAYFSDRQESEVVVRPCRVRGIRLAEPLADKAAQARAE